MVVPVKTVQTGKSAMIVCSTSDEALKCLRSDGFACLEPGFTAPWEVLETMMDKLDQETIDKVNSVYNEKKIIKSPKLTDKENIDRLI